MMCCNAQAVLVDFSADFAPLNDALGKFLFERFYKDYRVLRGTVKGQLIIGRLFNHFLEHPQLLPPVWSDDYHSAKLRGADRLGREAQRILADFIAGMTDREAYGLHKELFEV